jgi:hypothetical protein
MKLIRIAIFSGGIVVLLLALGFIFQVPFVTAIWPWTDGRLSYLFVGSILAAASASMLWIGWSGELGAMAGGVSNLLVIGASASIYFFRLAVQEERTNLIPALATTLLMALASAAILVWCRGLALRDVRPMPRLARISFVVFLLALVSAAAALIFRLPVFPWALNPDSSVIFGCIFLGNATYFLYGLLYPRWHNTLGQLLSFLAYDVVLIGPFLMLFAGVKPEFLFSLVVYVAVLVYSGALAVYYLFFNKGTKSDGLDQPGKGLHL